MAMTKITVEIPAPIAASAIATSGACRTKNSRARRKLNAAKAIAAAIKSLIQKTAAAQTTAPTRKRI